MKEFDFYAFNKMLKISQREGAEDGKDVIHRLHSHENYEIIRILSGKASYQVKGMFFSAAEGDIIVIDRNIFHHIMPDNEYRRTVISLEHKLLNLFNFKIDLFKCFRQATEHDSYVISDSVLKQLGLDQKFDELTRLARGGDASDNQEVVLIRIIDILMDIRRAFSSESFRAEYQRDEIIAKIIKYVDENIKSDLSLEKIGAHLFLSKFYLCHYFRNKTNTSLFSYIQYKRIATAKILIENGMSAQNAAYESGFNNYSNFYKAFKKITGKFPTEMRQDKS